MTKEALIAPIWEKYDELVGALENSNIERIREQALEVHAKVHPAEISGRNEKIVADYVLDYVLAILAYL